MTDQTPSDRLTQVEQRQQRQDETVAQIYEILLLTAQRQERSAQQIAANAQQIAANSEGLAELREGLAELRAILRDRYSNGQSGDRP